MVVDDAYIIVGSANINQRSMAGTRDTEMAVGCWQPSFTDDNCSGDVHMFRMSLWTEHMCETLPVFRYFFGKHILNDVSPYHESVNPIFRQPHTLECVRQMKEMISYNWSCYIARDLMPTPGHCLPYPINVMEDGSIGSIEGCEEFPDFPPGSTVLGCKTSYLPVKLTT